MIPKKVAKATVLSRPIDQPRISEECQCRNVGCHVAEDAISMTSVQRFGNAVIFNGRSRIPIAGTGFPDHSEERFIQAEQELRRLKAIIDANEAQISSQNEKVRVMEAKISSQAADMKRIQDAADTAVAAQGELAARAMGRVEGLLAEVQVAEQQRDRMASDCEEARLAQTQAEAELRRLRVTLSRLENIAKPLAHSSNRGHPSIHRPLLADSGDKHTSNIVPPQAPRQMRLNLRRSYPSTAPSELLPTASAQELSSGTLISIDCSAYKFQIVHRTPLPVTSKKTEHKHQVFIAGFY